MNHTQLKHEHQPRWYPVCHVHDLVPGSGVCVRLGEAQIALFYLPNEAPTLYALGNWDPKGRANVLSRGIVGDVDGTLVVASPLYKHHYCLETGQCLEDEACTIPVFPTRIDENQVWVVAA